MTTPTPTLSRVLRGCVAVCLNIKDLKKVARPLASFGLDWKKERGLIEFLHFLLSKELPSSSGKLYDVCEVAFGHSARQNAVRLRFWALITAKEHEPPLPFHTEEECTAFICAFFESYMTRDGAKWLAERARRVAHSARESGLPDSLLPELMRKEFKEETPYLTFRAQFAPLVRQCKKEGVAGNDLFALFEEARVRTALKIAADTPRPEVVSTSSVVDIRTRMKKGGGS